MTSLYYITDLGFRARGFALELEVCGKWAVGGGVGSSHFTSNLPRQFKAPILPCLCNSANIVVSVENRVIFISFYAKNSEREGTRKCNLVNNTMS